MIAYERSECARKNFGKFIYQFQPETKTLIKKLERIFLKLYLQYVFLLYNETYLNERLLPNYTYFEIHDTAAHRDTNAQKYPSTQLLHMQVTLDVNL